MRKLDPALRSLLELSRKRERAEPPPSRVDIAVKFSGDIEDLRAIGFADRTVLKHPTAGFTIASGSIPLENLDELAAIPHVIKVEGSRSMKPELNNSVPDIRADQVHNASTPFKGAGVVMGVIDSGFDYTHHSFRKADGTSRILALWDQRLTPQSGESSPAGFGLGVEYSKADIDSALQASDPFSIVRSKDSKKGHGTHVAGIAAGDGSQSGNCRGAFTFVGVAPEADLILVKLRTGDIRIGESNNLIDAFDYIFSHTQVAGRPVVINLSQGDNLGPHDGTSLVEQAIDIFLLSDSRALIKSAGNEADDDHHAEGSVPAGGSLEVELQVQADDSDTRYLELWYPGGSSLDVRVSAPGSPAPTSPVVTPGNRTTWTVNPGAPAARQTDVVIDSDTNDPDNGDNRIVVELQPPSSGNLPAGRWKLRLENAGGAAVAFDVWIERGDDAPEFKSHVTNSKTISIPGTTDSVITVAAYAAEGSNEGELGNFSSRGPTRDGRDKPDIAAPGVGVTSAKSRVGDNCCSDCCVDFYKDKNGTSMAAPHVAGTVALMFQKNPGLSADEIKQILIDTARTPEGITGTPPVNEWGAGLLDALAAVNAVPSPGSGGGSGGGGGGGGGGGPSPFAPVENPDVSASFPTLGDPLRPHLLYSLMDDLRATVLRTPTGQRCAALVSKHFSEVRGLINSNRRVATAWHRLQGPRLVRILLELAHEPESSPSLAITGGDLSDRVAGFLDVLARQGSDTLVSDIRRYRAEVEDLASAGPTALWKRFIEPAA